MLKCKGSFQTCEICNNANELLRNRSKRYSRAKRDIIMRFKAMHLDQQAAERDELDLKKKLATKMDATTNQPTSALFFAGK